MGGVIRFSRLPIVTPDAMGGRVSAVNSMFTGASIRWASSKAASPRVVRHANGRARLRHRHNPGGLIPRRLFPKLFRTEAPDVLTRQAYRPAATARERWLPAT
jgi:hypothetical protein